MATLLRSLRHVRAYNRAGSTLARLTRVANHTSLTGSDVNVSRIAQYLACNTFDNRNYVTKVATAPSTQSTNTQYQVDRLLRDADFRIKRYGALRKSDFDEMMRAITEAGSLTTTQALHLIRCCGNFLEAENLKVRRSIAQNIWEIIKDYKIALDISHYNALLLVNLENEQDFSPADFLVELKNQGIEPNRVTFQRLIEYYCNKGDIAGATKILEHMSQEGTPINENIFNSLVKGHTIAGDVPNALKVVNIMTQAGIEPSSRTYSAVLCAHATVGDVEAIQATLKECHQKDILFSDKDILDVIYTLAVSGHSQFIDELKNLFIKGANFNKDIKTYANKLVENNQLEIAYGLLKNMSKLDDQMNDRDGIFFIRKLINCDIDPKTVAHYCKLMKIENYNPNAFEKALLQSLKSNKYQYAFPLMKAMKENDVPVREHYFYPLMVSYGHANNLKGILTTIKSMTNDFDVTPSVLTIKDYVLPYMMGDSVTNAKMLMDNNVPFGIIANAIVNHLISSMKLVDALKFTTSSNLTYRSRLLKRSLVNAMQNTTDVATISEIIHLQYARLYYSENDSSNEEGAEDLLTAKQFAGSFLYTVIKTLPPHGTKIIDELIKKFLEKGISIEQESCDNIKLMMGSKLKPEVSDMLDKLISEDLKPAQVDKFAGEFRGSSQMYQNQNIEKLEQKAESSLEFKLLLVQEYAKMRNIEAVNKLLKELEQQNPTYTNGFCASLIDYFSKIDDVDNADEWFRRFKALNPEAKLDRTKLINYAEALIQKGRPEDAIKILDEPVNDPEVDRSLKSEKLLGNVLKCCPQLTKTVFDKLVENGFIKKPSIVHLQAIVKSHLEHGDMDGALEKFKWACDTYQMTPLRNVIMMALIEKEDAQRLQQIVDYCTKIYGEVNSLLDLSVAFFESNKPRQARKILETPGLRLRREKIMNIVDRFAIRNEVEKLENFIQLLWGIYLDIDPIYCKLLQTYEKKGDWQRGLALWTQMQEDNVQPSPEFLKTLDQLLRSHDQNPPFNIVSPHDENVDDKAKKFTQHLIERDFENAKSILSTMNREAKVRYTLHLVEALAAEDHMNEALNYLHKLLSGVSEINSTFHTTVSHVLTKLAEANDFSNIAQTVRLFNQAVKKNPNNRTFSFSQLIGKFYLDNRKYADFVKNLDSLLDSNVPTTLINSLIHISTACDALKDQPEIEEEYKKFAYKAVKKNVYAPINALWIHKFTIEHPEAEQIWNETLQNSTRFSTLSAAITLKKNDAFDKYPALAEKIVQSNMLSVTDRRKSFAMMFKFLLDSDASNKYEIAYELVRQALKIIPYHRLNQNVLQTIEENLQQGLSLQSLREDMHKLQEKAA
ncbi:leucine-rich PPR motif-containing protein, mitochondrial [Trichogramma pretiosum]|uniref:leucine-rich PPR motif-containing protein, mitochondrial n=1 Tax=Trichogramma pretiosum TaxID=7493 RepID=UPI0006C9E589|nr:leucine-rich PPR motif-containing protein, mitochondrial [Trichogramma pretiosum]